jgi:hypothetical protein
LLSLWYVIGKIGIQGAIPASFGIRYRYRGCSDRKRQQRHDRAGAAYLQSQGRVFWKSIEQLFARFDCCLYAVNLEPLTGFDQPQPRETIAGLIETRLPLLNPTSLTTTVLPATKPASNSPLASSGENIRASLLAELQLGQRLPAKKRDTRVMRGAEAAFPSVIKNFAMRLS